MNGKCWVKMIITSATKVNYGISLRTVIPKKCAQLLQVEIHDKIAWEAKQYGNYYALQLTKTVSLQKAEVEGDKGKIVTKIGKANRNESVLQTTIPCKHARLLQLEKYDKLLWTIKQHNEQQYTLQIVKIRMKKEKINSVVELYIKSEEEYKKMKGQINF
jgi:hypothetical protein